MHVVFSAAKAIAMMSLAAATCVVSAQSWPARSVTVVVPFPAGGASDTIGRVVTERLQAELKVPFIIENKSGAGGTLGAAAVAKAPADGYTFLVATSADQVNAPYLYAKLPYDPAKDFMPVAWLARDVILMAATATATASSVADVISSSVQKPLTFASSGHGTTGHIAGEVFKSLTGANVLHVPYRGNAPAVNDTVAGHTQLVFIGPAPSLPQIQAGKLKPIAVASERRLASLPDVPTFNEKGVPLVVNTWYALMAPAGTPPEIVRRMNAAVNKILIDPLVINRLSDLGLELRTGTAADLGSTLTRDREYWGKFLKTANIRLD